jgi:hypothetical protein
MGRSAKTKTSSSTRKPVSFAVERVFPAPANPARAGETAASPRVRDSLVLRLVAKKKTARKDDDERAR